MHYSINQLANLFIACLLVAVALKLWCLAWSSGLCSFLLVLFNLICYFFLIRCSHLHIQNTLRKTMKDIKNYVLRYLRTADRLWCMVCC